MSEPIHELACGHCGGSIIANERTIAHTVPACSWFERIMKHAGVPGELDQLHLPIATFEVWAFCVLPAVKW